MFLFPLWLWSSLAPGSWKRICSTSSAGTTFGGKARLWLPFFSFYCTEKHALLWKVEIFAQTIFFSSQTFQNFASDQTKLADFPSEIKIQKSISMCKKILCKIPPYFFFSVETKKPSYTSWIYLIPFYGALWKKILLLSLYLCACFLYFLVFN